MGQTSRGRSLEAVAWMNSAPCKRLFKRLDLELIMFMLEIFVCSMSQEERETRTRMYGRTALDYSTVG
jgi:hypothetical protein